MRQCLPLTIGIICPVTRLRIIVGSERGEAPHWSRFHWRWFPREEEIPVLTLTRSSIRSASGTRWHCPDAGRYADSIPEWLRDIRSSQTQFMSTEESASLKSNL